MIGTVLRGWVRPDAQHGPRSVRAVIVDHLERRARGDVEGDILRNYAADVLVLSPRGRLEGADGVRWCGEELAEAVGPGGCLDYGRLSINGPLGHLEWTASGPSVAVCQGAESLVVSEGRIIAQAVHYATGGIRTGGGRP